MTYDYLYIVMYTRESRVSVPVTFTYTYVNLENLSHRKISIFFFLSFSFSKEISFDTKLNGIGDRCLFALKNLHRIIPKSHLKYLHKRLYYPCKNVKCEDQSRVGRSSFREKISFTQSDSFLS